MLTLYNIFLTDLMRETSLRAECGIRKKRNIAISTKTPFFSKKKSYSERTKSYKPQKRALNETLLPMM